MRRIFLSFILLLSAFVGADALTLGDNSLLSTFSTGLEAFVTATGDTQSEETIIVGQTEVPVVETLTVNYNEVEKTAYGDGSAEFDVDAVIDALGISAISEATLYIVNVTTNVAVENTTDGWRNASGDAEAWNTSTGMVCVKIDDPASGLINYIGCMDDTHVAGETYTAKWAFVANNKAAVIDVVITFVESEESSEEDSNPVVGQWYSAEGDYIYFNADGTTNYPGGATYTYQPVPSRILVKTSAGAPLCLIPVAEATSEHLLIMDYGTGVFTYYYSTVPVPITSITLSQTTLTTCVGMTELLDATVAPSNATLKSQLKWTSSNESVVTVDDGFLEPLSEGTATITCAATDGSGVFAACEVTVNELETYITSISVPLSVYYLYLGDQKEITASILPEDADYPWVYATCSDNSVVSVQDLGNNQFKLIANQPGTAEVTLKAQDGSGVTKEFGVVVKDHESVDLGLPSGTLWATQNIGADEIYESGLYFAWGETVGHTSDVSDGYKFDYANYKYYEGSTDHAITKYCSDSSYGYNGFVDNLTELELSDDAAYVNWGSNWCMPTQAQMVELFNSDNCTLKWTDVGSEYGLLITSIYNSKQIFLPAAGYRNSTTFDEAGEKGYYWSKTLYNGTTQAYRAVIFDEGYYNNNNARYHGYTIRPVRRQ
ncbi:MAG: Ig-like domain-containing protein [Prevotella sp.]|nr:Ig-like domain-containing protein [Prevotella sp.]